MVSGAHKSLRQSRKDAVQKKKDWLGRAVDTKSTAPSKEDLRRASELANEAIKAGVVKVHRTEVNGRKPYIRKRYTGI